MKEVGTMNELALRPPVDAAGEATGLARERRLLSVLFFFSGFPALMYQLVWQRALFRILGVNIESVTIVVTAFMLGLGLGSLAGGWLSRRRGVPLLLLLAGIESATAVFGLVSLDVFDRVGELALGMPLAPTAAVTLALVIVPTLLMGATLPVLVGHLAQRSGNVGSSVGLLYYVNTLGAGAACLVCVVLFFPFLGMGKTVMVAAGMNGAVALGAILSHFRAGFAPGQAAATDPDGRHAPMLPFPPLLGLACLGGFISLSYEIFLFRAMSFASGSSASAFAATLGAFLIGLASGSRRAGEVAAEGPGGVFRHLVRTLLFANLVGCAFLPALAHLAWLDRGLVGVMLLMTYLLARGWGGLLPLLAHLGVAPDGQAGMRTALVYLANIVGAATGSVMTGFVLMDRMGLVTLAAALVGVGLACVALVVAAMPLPAGRKGLGAGGAMLAGASAFLALPNLAAGALEAMQWKGLLPDKRPFAHVAENRSGIITVDSDGTVFGHGMYDGKFNTDLLHDTNGIVRPYALSLFHPRPREVLLIGLSTGSWAQVIASNPAVESLTVVEINPGYGRLVAQVPEVASVLGNPKVKLVVDDGRRWLRLNPQKRFDAIVSNTTWHFRANATNLLSVEFLELARQHLQPGGIFFYNTTDSLRVQRTGCRVFPHGARFTNHLVVSDAPLDWNTDRWLKILASYRIDGRAVIPSGGEHLPEVAGLTAKVFALPPERSADGRSSVAESCQSILERSAGLVPVTDDNMGTEWRHAFGLE